MARDLYVQDDICSSTAKMEEEDEGRWRRRYYRAGSICIAGARRCAPGLGWWVYKARPPCRHACPTLPPLSHSGRVLRLPGTSGCCLSGVLDADRWSGWSPALSGPALDVRHHLCHASLPKSGAAVFQTLTCPLPLIRLRPEPGGKCAGQENIVFFCAGESLKGYGSRRVSAN